MLKLVGAPLASQDNLAMQSIETAAFAAWPSLATEEYEGWHLRLDAGYTKRANSANSSALARTLSDSDVDYIESRFRGRGLVPTFRLASPASVAASDRLLVERGYRFADLSLVMTTPLPVRPASSPLRVAPDPASWLADFQAVSGKSSDGQAAHLQIIQRIQHPCALATTTEAGRPVCCGLGVLVGDQLGLFDITTRPDRRGQGLAKALCLGILAWGQEKGAKTAFLQVTGANTTAIGLYERLGFRHAYHYWYRVLSSD
jgi:hypothetical protein